MLYYATFGKISAKSNERLEVIDKKYNFLLFFRLTPLNPGIKNIFEKNKNYTFLHLPHRTFMQKIRKIQ